MNLYDHSSDKRALRRILRGTLQSLASRARETGSKAIVEQLDVLFRSLPGGPMTVLIYSALALEPNIWEIVQRQPDHRHALPRIVGEKAELECRLFRDREKDLERGAFGISEPRRDRCPLVGVAEIDLAIVPALALTPRGERLGRGGGHYDRLLGDPDMRARRVGVCFDCQLYDRLPVEPHDCSVDVVITETRQWVA